MKRSAIICVTLFPFCWMKASPSRTRYGSFSSTFNRKMVSQVSFLTCSDAPCPSHSFNSGITEENLTKLIQHAQIPNEDRDMITNLALVGCNVVVDVRPFVIIILVERVPHFLCFFQGNKKRIWQIRRKERINDQTYQMSRWTPVLKDVIEDCIDEKLDNSHFPFLGGQRHGSQFSSGAPSR